jgi:hypothetical protein
VTRYRVKAAYVTVKTMTPDGAQMRGLYSGAPVPEDAPERWIKGHLESKMIEAIPEPKPVAPPDPPKATAPAAAKPAAAKG